MLAFGRLDPGAKHITATSSAVPTGVRKFKFVMPSVTSGYSFDPPATEVQAVTTVVQPIDAVPANDKEMIKSAMSVVNSNDSAVRAPDVQTPSQATRQS